MIQKNSKTKAELELIGLQLEDVVVDEFYGNIKFNFQNGMCICSNVEQSIKLRNSIKETKS